MNIDARKTAVLAMDLQMGIFDFAPGARACLPQAARAAQAARDAGMLLIHVGLGFEPGYPEISPRHPRFSMLKDRGLFVVGSESARVHADIIRPGELLVCKRRVGAFSGSTLGMILSSRGVENLVMFGVSTSGVVLSTLRAASDMDYRCVVIKDACFDPDPEVHRVLTEKVFPAQAEVATADEFASARAAA